MTIMIKKHFADPLGGTRRKLEHPIGGRTIRKLIYFYVTAPSHTDSLKHSFIDIPRATAHAAQNHIAITKDMQ